MDKKIKFGIILIIILSIIIALLVGRNIKLNNEISNSAYVQETNDEETDNESLEYSTEVSIENNSDEKDSEENTEMSLVEQLEQMMETDFSLYKQTGSKEFILENLTGAIRQETKSDWIFGSEYDKDKSQGTITIRRLFGEYSDYALTEEVLRESGYIDWMQSLANYLKDKIDSDIKIIIYDFYTEIYTCESE